MRVTRLADPGFARLVAELYASGISRPAMAEELDAHVDTVTTWVKDDRVQDELTKVIRERINRVTRKIDSEIERRLGDEDTIKNMTTEELVRLRKEFLDRGFFKSSGGADSSGLSEADAWRNTDPAEQADAAAAAE